MPMYEYQCEACGEQFEVIRKFSDPPLELCEKCGKGPIQRLVSSPAFQFKGSGWYITDYAKKGTGSSTDGATKDSSTTDSSAKDSSGSAKSDTGSSEKSESKSSESSKTETPAKPAAPSGSKD
jgi:putative FmdB family regulatory protein